MTTGRDKCKSMIRHGKVFDGTSHETEEGDVERHKIAEKKQQYRSARDNQMFTMKQHTEKVLPHISINKELKTLGTVF